MYSCEFYKDFNSIYFTEHPRATASVFCIVFFNFSKPFPTIVQYLKNCNCKLSLKIVWLSQSLTLHCYLRVWNSLSVIANLMIFEDILKDLSTQ